MKIIKRIGWFIVEEKWSYIFGVMALAALALLNVISPRIIGILMDQMIESTLTYESLVMYALALVAIALTMYGMRYIWRIYLFGASFRLERKMRLSFFEHLTKMAPSFYQNHRIGDLMARATSDIRAIQRVAGGGVLQLADSLLSGTVTLFAMAFTIDLKLTLAVLLPMPIMIIGSQILSKKLHSAFSKAQASFSNMNNRVHESISGMKVTKTFGQENLEIDRFKEESEEVYTRYMAVSRWDILFNPMVMTVIVSCYVIIFTYGVSLIKQGVLSTGMLITFTTYMHTLIWPMMAIGFLFNTIQRGNASFERIEKIMNEPEDVVNFEGSLKEMPIGDLVFNVDRFKYPDTDSQVALNDIKFTLKSGETLGIAGKTGSGKSTLIKLLLREYDVEEGIINIGGTNIKDYDLHSLRSSIGYVPQDNFLFSMSIMDNIRFGNPNATLEDVIEVAKIADIHESIMGFELGYETMMGERGVTLSGGQKQRVSIARALLLDPQILILDDSLSAVDAKTEEKILSALKKTRKNKTTIIAAHRMSALKHAEVILVMDKGVIIERGTHLELMDAKGWYADIYDQQEFTKEKKHDGRN
jgi:ATP-binding cassette, subfamily B, multidrug efflux pump